MCLSSTLSLVRAMMPPSFRSTLSLLRVSAVVVMLNAGALVSQAAAQARATPLQTMAQEARVSKETARMTALGRVPGGRMSSIELRRTAGKLVYLASITQPGKPQKVEVVVDAMTGAVISKRP